MNVEQFIDWERMNDDDDNFTAKQEENCKKNKSSIQKDEEICQSLCTNNEGKENEIRNNKFLKESLELIQKLIHSLCANKARGVTIYFHHSLNVTGFMFYN